MRIETIEIKNFRQYQNVALTFPQSIPGGNNLHIILGSNGVGKTNILNAITWCLYDEELHLGDRNTSVQLLNYTEAEKLRSTGSKTGEVSVTIKISSEDGSNPAIFERKEQFTINEASVFPLPSKLTVKVFERNGWQINDDPETTKFLVNKYLPESINEYIFFDGEHLEHYFQEGEKDNIKNGINKLTQIDIIDKAISAYGRYTKSELDSQLSSADDKEVSKLQQKLSDAEENISTQVKIINEIDTQIKDCDTQIENVKAKIKGNEQLPDKIKEQEEIEELINQEERARKDTWNDIYSMTREYYQIFAIYPAINCFYNFIKEQEQAGKLPPRIDKKLLEEILETKRCYICNSPLDENGIQAVRRMLDNLEVSSEVSARLNRSLSAMEGLISKMKTYKSQRERLFSTLKSIEDRYKKLSDKLTSLNKYISTIPKPEEIAKAVKDHEEIKATKDDLLISLGEKRQTLTYLESQKTNIEHDLDRALQNDSRLTTIRNKKQYCIKCQKILETIKEEILKECRLEMEKMTYDIFKRLVWKEDFFATVKISENFDFKLINKYGDQSLGSCSAAERALLALSFTLALQHSSQHDSLLFIDTPIGRVDEANRSNFIKTLLDISKNKQVILTFTPTEYDDNVKSLLNGNYRTLHKLNMNNSITTIE